MNIDDIVWRLRLPNKDGQYLGPLCNEAADEIESLRRQLEAFHRLSAQRMSASGQRGQNVAQGQD